MNYLKFEEIKVGDYLTWHPDYYRQAWIDAIGPLIVTSVSRIDKKSFFIGYKCFVETCRLCRDNSLSAQGHHKLIKQGGLDLHGRTDFVETKKKTIEKHIDQPVFIRAVLHSYLI
jgi:hypothetical protein